MKTISASSWDIGVKYTQRYVTAVHTCKNMTQRVEIWKKNTLITASEQFTTSK